MNLDQMYKVGEFKIPEDIAMPLSKLMSKKSLIMQLMDQNINDDDKFETYSEKGIALEDEIQQYQRRINETYLPDKFKLPHLQWNYNGYALAGCTIEVYSTDPDDVDYFENKEDITE